MSISIYLSIYIFIYIYIYIYRWKLCDFGGAAASGAPLREVTGAYAAPEIARAVVAGGGLDGLGRGASQVVAGHT